MSCLKSASNVIAPFDAGYKDKVRLTLAAARCFERYVCDGSIDQDIMDPDMTGQDNEGKLTKPWRVK